MNIHRTHNTTDDTDRAPQVDPIDVAYYSDPDAAANILAAADGLRTHIGDFNSDVHQMHLTNPEHRAWIRTYVANILTSLDDIEDYDNETIHLTLAHQEKN